MSLSLPNHPAGLYVCFMTELWERFSYYGMRALLIYYLTQHFLFSDEKSFAIYGAYTALVWMSPVIGGVVADRYLGSRKAVTLGAILLSVGHLLLAIEGPGAKRVLIDGVELIQRDAYYLNFFYLSLAFIVTGVGFLKTNISTIVGALYSLDDPRREAGFTLFYMGINIGAALAPLLCGWLGQTYGWHYGFGLAGIGMLAGLLGFLLCQKHLEGHAEPPNPDRLGESIFPGISREVAIYIASGVMVLLFWQLLQHQAAVGGLLGFTGSVLAVVVLYYSFRYCTPKERDQMLVVALLILFSIVFWSLYEQMGSSLNLFSDRVVDRHILGWEIQASQLQALAPIFVVSLAPLFSWLWTRLGRQNRNPSIPIKFTIGLAMVGVAFLVPVLGMSFSGNGEKVGLLWFVLMFFFMVCGELCIGPIALNLVTRLCPKRVVGMMMGSFFLSLSAGSFIAGQLSKLTSVEIKANGHVSDVTPIVDAYTASYSLFGVVSLVIAALLYLLSPLLRRVMHEGS